MTTIAKLHDKDHEELLTMRIRNPKLSSIADAVRYERAKARALDEIVHLAATSRLDGAFIAPGQLEKIVADHLKEWAD